MKIAYVFGPYRGRDNDAILRNIIKAQETAFKLWEVGFAVICPHLNTTMVCGGLARSAYILPMFKSMVGGETVDENNQLFIDGDLEMVRRSDFLVCCDPVNWRQSKGSVGEYNLAAELGKPIYFSPESAIRIEKR